jgi:hypothetical protein
VKPDRAEYEKDQRRDEQRHQHNGVEEVMDEVVFDLEAGQCRRHRDVGNEDGSGER